MRIETEQQAREYAKAATFGATESVDGFMRFWQDPWLRAQIHKQASKWSQSREDYQDLWGEAWASVCELPPDLSFSAVWRVDSLGRPVGGEAYKAMQRYWKRELRYRKRVIPFSRFSGEIVQGTRGGLPCRVLIQ